MTFFDEEDRHEEAEEDVTGIPLTTQEMLKAYNGKIGKRFAVSCLANLT